MVFWDNVGLVNSNFKKSQALVSFPEVLSENYKRGRPREAKEMIYHKRC